MSRRPRPALPRETFDLETDVYAATLRRIMDREAVGLLAVLPRTGSVGVRVIMSNGRAVRIDRFREEQIADAEGGRE